MSNPIYDFLDAIFGPFFDLFEDKPPASSPVKPDAITPGMVGRLPALTERAPAPASVADDTSTERDELVLTGTKNYMGRTARLSRDSKTDYYLTWDDQWDDVFSDLGWSSKPRKMSPTGMMNFLGPWNGVLHNFEDMNMSIPGKGDVTIPFESSGRSLVVPYKGRGLVQPRGWAPHTWKAPKGKWVMTHDGPRDQTKWSNAGSDFVEFAEGSSDSATVCLDLRQERPPYTVEWLGDTVLKPRLLFVLYKKRVKKSSGESFYDQLGKWVSKALKSL